MGNKSSKSSARRPTTPSNSPPRDSSNFGFVFDQSSSDHQPDSSNFGCTHYTRRCRIRAPCCDQIFDCRHCHDEAMNSFEVDPTHRHNIPRHEVKRVICSLCNTEQSVKQYCSNCGVCMGNYFCAKCKFFDDDVSKEQFHCKKCGICRTGGEENFFHCDNCGCCYGNMYRTTHRCVERAIHDNCPICSQFLFDSTKHIMALPCGHLLHVECVNEMQQHSQYSCPLCSKSIVDMSEAWRDLDEEVAETPLPEEYRYKKVSILCNDCGGKSKARYHTVGLKCRKCHSYNTKQI